MEFQNESHEPDEWNFVTGCIGFFVIVHVHIISLFWVLGGMCVLVYILKFCLKWKNVISVFFFTFLVIFPSPIEVWVFIELWYSSKCWSVAASFGCGQAILKECTCSFSQSLQDEAESSEGSWEKLQEVIGKLKDHCPSVAEIIEEKCQDTHARYALRYSLNNSRYLYLNNIWWMKWHRLCKVILVIRDNWFYAILVSSASKHLV